MNKRINRVLALLLMVFFLIASVTSCKQKTSDADLKTSVEQALAGTGGSLARANVDVKDGVVTLTGEVTTEVERASAETFAKGVNGVKSVVNNLTVAPPPSAPVVITADDPLRTSVDATIKTYPGVSATVQDGVVTLTGEIKRADLQNLMAALNTLKPKKIENKLTIK